MKSILKNENKFTKAFIIFVIALTLFFAIMFSSCKKQDSDVPGLHPYCAECQQVYKPSFTYQKCSTLDACNRFEDSLKAVYGAKNIHCDYIDQKPTYKY